MVTVLASLRSRIRKIKLKAEQSLISALTCFYKRKLELLVQEKELKANAAFAARKQKPVTRNPLKETHSANNIVHNDVNIADLQKQISDCYSVILCPVYGLLRPVDGVSCFQAVIFNCAAIPNFRT